MCAKSGLSVDDRTQQIIAERIGMLLIGTARLQAELEKSHADAEAAKAGAVNASGAKS